MTTNCIFFYSCQPSYIFAKKQINKRCQAIFSVSYLNFGSTHNMLNTVLICEKIVSSLNTFWSKTYKICVHYSDTLFSFLRARKHTQL